VPGPAADVRDVDARRESVKKAGDEGQGPLDEGGIEDRASNLTDERVDARVLGVDDPAPPWRKQSTSWLSTLPNIANCCAMRARLFGPAARVSAPACSGGSL